jgi:hypothetical protein
MTSSVLELYSVIIDLKLSLLYVPVTIPPFIVRLPSRITQSHLHPAKGALVIVISRSFAELGNMVEMPTRRGVTIP